MRSHTRIRVIYDIGAITPEMVRYKQMCSSFYKVADLATDDPDSYSLVMEWLEVKMKELYTKKYPTATLKPIKGDSIKNSPTDAPPKVQDPKRKKTKGRPRETRLKSPIEGSKQKSKKKKNSSRKVNDDAGQSSQLPGILCTQKSVVTTQNTTQNNPNKMGNINFHPSGLYGMMPQPSGPYGMMLQPSGPYGMMLQSYGPYGMMSQPSGPYGMMPQPSISFSESID
ncbi:hypothetical protein OROMI_005806 [Orobanche minor]